MRRHRPGRCGAAHRAKRLNKDTRERGAVMVEAAMIVPLVLVLVFGMIDFGLLLGKSHNATQATRAGARETARLSRQPGYQTIVRDAVVQSLGSFEASATKIAIYRVDPSSTDGLPVGASSRNDLWIKCTVDCWRYEWNGSTWALMPGGDPWDDDEQHACPPGVGTGIADEAGIYVEGKHDYVTLLLGPVLGSSFTIRRTSTARLWPVQSDVPCEP